MRIVVRPHDCSPAAGNLTFSRYLSDSALMIRRLKPIHTVEELAEFIVSENDYFQNFICMSRIKEDEVNYE